MDIDFSEVIEIDFSAEELGDDLYTLKPKVKNLGVFSLEWTFGDGRTSSETSPNYRAPETGTSTIALRVNDIDALTVKKQLSATGELTDYPLTVEVAAIPEEGEETELPTNQEKQTYTIPYLQASYINNVIRLSKGEQLDEYLRRLNRDGIINYGPKSAMPDSEKSYLAVIHPQTREVVAVLSPEAEGKRFILTTDEQIEESKLADKFKGLGSVWFQFK